MRVPKNNHVCLNLLDHLPVTLLELMQLAKDMTNDDSVSGEVLYALSWKCPETVVVALDREDWSDLFQAINHFELSDVTGMYYRVDAGEDRNYRLIEKPVCI